MTRPPVRRRGEHRQIGQLLGFAMAGVAVEFANRLERHLRRHKRTLRRRGQLVSASAVKRLLLESLGTALLAPDADAETVTQQRNVLVYLLAAANVRLDASSRPIQRARLARGQARKLKRRPWVAGRRIAGLG